MPGTREEIAATPRSDRNLELLALHLSNGVTADEEIYRRLVRDVASIRELDPAMRGIGYFSAYPGDGLHVSLDDQQYAKVRNREYHAWDCLNEHFGVTEVSPTSSNLVTLIFRGRFNVPKLAPLYAKLPGVRFAEPVLMVGDGPTIYVTPGPGAWHYVFDDAAGDCPMGCTEFDARYFVVDIQGTPTFHGRWSSVRDAGKPPPLWAIEYRPK